MASIGTFEGRATALASSRGPKVAYISSSFSSFGKGRIGIPTFFGYGLHRQGEASQEA